MATALGGLGPWIRSEWRNSWRSLLGVALLVALGGGTTIAAVAGARRADTAVDRFLSQTGGPITVTAMPTGVAPGDAGAHDTSLAVWSALPAELAALPGVEGVTPAAWMAVALQADGVPGFFFTPAIGVGVGDDPPTGFVVIEGRLPAHDAIHEIALDEQAAELTDASIGDTIELRSYAADQFGDFMTGDGGPDHGPRVEVEVVGVIRGAEDVAQNPDPFGTLSAAFRDHYRDEIAFCDCSLIVRAAPENVTDVVATVTAAVADRELVVEDFYSEVHHRVDHAIGLEVGALWIASAIAFVAAVLIAAQAIVRHVAGGRRSASALTAIGATVPDLVRAWAVIVTPVAVIGALGAGALAVSLSPLFPRGLARRAELDAGVRIDAMAVGLGMLIIVVVVMGTVIAVTATSARRWQSAEANDIPRGRLNGWATMLRPSVSLGVNLAVDPSRDRSILGAGAAVMGLAVAIGGILAVVVIEGSADEVLATPNAFGADWDLEIIEPPSDPEAVIAATMAEPIDALAFRMVVSGTDFVVIGDSGDGYVQPIAFDHVLGTIGPVMLSGRPLSADSDVVIGDDFAATIGAEVGDDIVVNPGGITFRVAGIGRMTDGDETDQAMVLTVDGLSRLQANPGDQLDLDGAFVRVGGGDQTTIDRLMAVGWREVTAPSTVSNLSQIGSVPRLLAGALAALGLAGAVHVLLLAVNRRGSDLAVARALGFTPRQARSSIVWQGVATAGAAIVIGIPLGVLIGRVVWKRVTDGVGAVDLVSIPWLAFAAVPALTLGAVTVAAWIVGRRAATLVPAVVLRSE